MDKLFNPLTESIFRKVTSRDVLVESVDNLNLFNGLYSFYKDGFLDYNYYSICEQVNAQTACPLSFSQTGEQESVSLYQTIDLLCEGPIEGLCDGLGNTNLFSNNPRVNENTLRGVYYNDVPVKNTFTDTFNYNRTFVDFRVGKENQTPLANFTNSVLNFYSKQTFNYNTTLFPVNKSLTESTFGRTDQLSFLQGSYVRILYKGGSNAAKHYGTNEVVAAFNDTKSLQNVRALEDKTITKVSHAITNDNVLAVSIDISVRMFRNANSGTKGDVGATFVIKSGYQGDDVILGDGGSVVYFICPMQGLATSEYVRTFIFPLPPSLVGIDRQITIFRIDTAPPVDNVTVSKDAQIKTITEIIPDRLNHPNSTIVGSLVDARGFAQIPKRTFDVKLLKVKIPSNYDPESRTYVGNWDGNFKKDLYWTDNPAWILYDIVTNKRFGLGKFGIDENFMDRWNLYSVAKYCDEFVPTGYSGLTKPLRFTVNPSGVEVTIADSEGLGEDVFLNRYPEGSSVCFYDLNKSTDGSGEKIYKSFKRIIYKPFYDKANNVFKFKILKEISVSATFADYPAVRNLFLQTQKTQSAREWLLNNILNQQNSTEEYITEYTEGLPIDKEVRSGLCVTQPINGKDILEPRFTCNIYFDQFQPALEVLNQIASIFRGLVYWSNNYIFVSSDRQRDAILLFNNSNVKEGLFNYNGTAKTARYTACLVRYTDKNDGFKQKAVYYEDAEALRDNDYLLREIIGLGITSRSQAERVATWNVLTEQTEREVISFSTGSEASMLMPGDVIKVQDKLKTVKRYGGRITDINYSSKKVTLDKGVAENLVGQKITLIVPKEKATFRDIDLQSKLKLKTPNDQPLTQEQIDQTRQTQIKQFTVASITNSNVVQISETTDEDFNLIPKGSLWSLQNTDSNYNITEIEYRVLNVVEQNPNEYAITAMLYNSTKFNNIDFSQGLSISQDSKSQTVLISDLPEPLVFTTDIDENISLANSDYYDAYFTAETSNYDRQLSVNFSSATTSLNNTNTGGYIIEVYKDGQKVRFILDGYDNNSFVVFLGDSRLFKSVSYEVYRYDTDYKLENLNI